MALGSRSHQRLQQSRVTLHNGGGYVVVGSCRLPANHGLAGHDTWRGCLLMTLLCLPGTVRNHL